MNKENKIKVYNKISGVVFSEKEKQKSNNEIQSKYDKRINDILHKIEFTDATPTQAYKMYPTIHHSKWYTHLYE